MNGGQLGNALKYLHRVVGGAEPAATGDGHLLEAFVARRDESAFAELLRRHGPMVQSVCRRLLSDPNLADDAFQATFLVLVRKAPSIARQNSVGGWLYRVAYHAALKARAAGVRLQSLSHEVADMAAEPASDFAELLPLLDEEVSRLPEKLRAPVVLCYLEGKTREEAARELGWTEGTVKGRLEKARDILRGRLARRGAVVAGAAVVTCLTGCGSRAVAGPLLANTTQAAAIVAAGSSAGVAATVAAIVEGVIKDMSLSRTKLLLMAAAAVTVIGSGVGLVSYKLMARENAPAAVPVPVAVAEAAGDSMLKEDHRVLPVAAKGRVIFSADAKQAAFLSDGKVQVWATADLLKADARAKPQASQALTPPEKAGFLQAIFLPANKGLVAASATGPKVIGIDGKDAAFKLPKLPNDAVPLSVSPDGQWLAMASGKKRAVLRRRDDMEAGAKVVGPVLHLISLAGERRPLALEDADLGVWTDDGAVYVSDDRTQDIRRVNLADGKATEALAYADVKKTCGQDVTVAVQAARGKGDAERILIVAQSRMPENLPPGNPPPQIECTVLKAGGKLHRIQRTSHEFRMGSDFQQTIVLPSTDLDRFLVVRMEHEGQSRMLEQPKTWIGTINDEGRVEEQQLAKCPFPKDLYNVHAHVLDQSADGMQALVLVTGEVAITKNITSPLDMPLLATTYGRAGMIGGTMLFQSWSLWRFDAREKKITPLTKLYAEKYDELKGVSIGLPGKLANFDDYQQEHFFNYSKHAGVIALSLNKQTVFSKGKDDLTNIAVLRVPVWREAAKEKNDGPSK